MGPPYSPSAVAKQINGAARKKTKQQASVRASATNHQSGTNTPPKGYKYTTKLCPSHLLVAEDTSVHEALHLVQHSKLEIQPRQQRPVQSLRGDKNLLPPCFVLASARVRGWLGRVGVGGGEGLEGIRRLGLHLSYHEACRLMLCFDVGGPLTKGPLPKQTLMWVPLLVRGTGLRSKAQLRNG